MSAAVLQVELGSSQAGGAAVACDQTYESTKRSRLTQLGFLGLNLRKRLKRTWAMGAMPL